MIRNKSFLLYKYLQNYNYFRAPNFQWTAVYKIPWSNPRKRLQLEMQDRGFRKLIDIVETISANKCCSKTALRIINIRWEKADEYGN